MDLSINFDFLKNFLNWFSNPYSKINFFNFELSYSKFARDLQNTQTQNSNTQKIWKLKPKLKPLSILGCIRLIVVNKIKLKNYSCMNSILCLLFISSILLETSIGMNVTSSSSELPANLWLSGSGSDRDNGSSFSELLLKLVLAVRSSSFWYRAWVAVFVNVSVRAICFLLSEPSSADSGIVVIAEATLLFVSSSKWTLLSVLFVNMLGSFLVSNKSLLLLETLTDSMVLKSKFMLLNVDIFSFLKERGAFNSMFCSFSSMTLE